MKINTIFFAFISILMISCGGNGEKEEVVIIQTEFGDMVVILFDDTPTHKENFLKLAKSGAYDQTIFHRVIKDFMIQGGDTSVNYLRPNPNQEMLDAEILPKYFHKKGALAAARLPDRINPKKASSSCEFYIVQGTKYSRNFLDKQETFENIKIINKAMYSLLTSNKYPELNAKMDSLKRILSPKEMSLELLNYRDEIEKIKGPLPTYSMPDEKKEAYSTVGGSPHLDGNYTVFGQVISGLEVIDSVAAQRVDNYNKPAKDIEMSMSVDYMSKDAILKKYGYQLTEVAEEQTTKK